MWRLPFSRRVFHEVFSDGLFPRCSPPIYHGISLVPDTDREKILCLGGNISSRISITFVSGKREIHTYYKYSRSLLKCFFHLE